MSYRGAIFDVDGVLVDSPHERAWRETLQLLVETNWRSVQPQGAGNVRFRALYAGGSRKSSPASRA